MRIYKKQLGLASLIFSLGFPMQGIAESLDILLYEDYKPFSYEADGRPNGLYFELVSAIAKQTNTDVKFHVYPFKRSLTMAEAGKGVVAGLLKTAKREQTLLYSNKFYTEETVFYQVKGQGHSFNSFDDIKGKEIGVIHGWTYGDKFNAMNAQNQFTVQTAHSDVANFQKLLLGRIDLYVVNSFSAQLTLKNLGETHRVEKFDKLVDKGDIYIAMSHQHPQKEFINRFNAALLKMQQDGSIDKIVQQAVQKF